jgi:hypothetical protein
MTKAIVVALVALLFAPGAVAAQDGEWDWDYYCIKADHAVSDLPSYLAQGGRIELATLEDCEVGLQAERLLNDIPTPDTAPVARPIVDYWDEWPAHMSSYRLKQLRLVGNANSNTVRGIARWFDKAAAAGNAEVKWLNARQPEACYKAEWNKWKRAVTNLRDLHRKGARAMRTYNRKAMKRLSRQQDGEIRRLNIAGSIISECPLFD